MGVTLHSTFEEATSGYPSTMRFYFVALVLASVLAFHLTEAEVMEDGTESVTAKDGLLGVLTGKVSEAVTATSTNEGRNHRQGRGRGRYGGRKYCKHCAF